MVTDGCANGVSQRQAFSSRSPPLTIDWPFCLWWRSDILAGRSEWGVTPTTPPACLGAPFRNVLTLSRANAIGAAEPERCSRYLAIPFRSPANPSDESASTREAHWRGTISPRSLFAKPLRPDNTSDLRRSCFARLKPHLEYKNKSVDFPRDHKISRTI